MTYLAVPIAPKSVKESEEQIKAAKFAGAEMLELRTDYLVHLSVDHAWQVIDHARQYAGDIPIIVTCRDYHQGGALRHSNQLRTDVLAAAVRTGADYLDVEYDNYKSVAIRSKISLALTTEPNTRIILSAHNFQTKFKNIRRLYNEIKYTQSGAIPKIVYSAHHINDCFDILDLTHEFGQELIAFCMDEPGFITRIIAKKLGAFCSFASIDDKTATAPGQPTVKQMKEVYRWDSINEQTELYGVIGSPVAHSLSPLVHNGCFVEAGFNKLFLPLIVAGGQQEFNVFLDNILSRGWLDFRGFSVTIPHKENAIEYVKSQKGTIDPLAERIGAANTIIISGTQFTAYNTDCQGAIDAIISALGTSAEELKKMPVAIIGAGGAARAIAAGLAEKKAKVIIYNRTVERAKQLARELKCDYAGLDALQKLKAKLVINCTSVGMHPHINATPVDEKFLNKDMAVFDTVYNPAETLLLKQAKQTGCTTISGVDMFINQAAAQFKLFTGQDANIDNMRKILSLKQ